MGRNAGGRIGYLPDAELAYYSLILTFNGKPYAVNFKIP